MYRIIYISFLLILSSALYGQNVNHWIEKGDEAFQSQNFDYAISYYLMAYSENPGIVKIWYNCANSYRELREYKNAISWYKKIIKDYEEKFPLSRYYLAQCYKRIGEYKYARANYNRFYRSCRAIPEFKQEILIAKHEFKLCESIINTTREESINVFLYDTLLNTKQGEFGPVMIDSTHLLVSTVKVDKENRLVSYVLMHTVKDWELIKTDTLLSDQNYIYSLGSHYKDNHICYSRSGIFSEKLTKLYKAEIKNKRLVNIQRFPDEVNREGANQRHPQLISFNEQEILLFSTDISGGFGAYDIWFAYFNDQGEVVSLENAGRNINSIANEMSPFFYPQDTVMYFSSEWHSSYGGLDLFQSFGDFDYWMQPENLGWGINSSYDELYYSFEPRNRYAHFSSNRPANKDESNCCFDVYGFVVPLTKNDSIRELQRKVRIEKRKEEQRESLSLLTPLDLYFENNSPEPSDNDTTANVDLLSLLDTYMNAYPEYIVNYTDGLRGKRKEKAEQEINDFFIDYVEHGKDRLVLFANSLEQVLRNGDRVVLYIQAYSSPLNSKDYNKKLAKRRISSLMNYIRMYENGVLLNYIESGQLSFQKNAIGENESSGGVSDDILDLRNSVYSPNAGLERRIQIRSTKIISE